MEHQALRYSWATVIAAGGEAPVELQHAAGQRVKGLFQFGGISSVQLVVAAANMAEFSPVVVACDSETRVATPVAGVKFADAGDTNIATVANGVEASGHGGPFVFLPADVPLLRAEHLVHFALAIERRLGATPPEIWFAAGLTSKGEVVAAHPDAPFTYLRLRDGQFASGGLYASSRRGFEISREVFESAARERKSQVKLAFKFGLLNALRYLSGRMSIADAELHGSRLLGGQAIIVPDCHPDTAIDFDNLNDYRYVAGLFDSSISKQT